jgi:hypothetical protein
MDEDDARGDVLIYMAAPGYDEKAKSTPASRRSTKGVF